jgi:hypothetical protein
MVFKCWLGILSCIISFHNPKIVQTRLQSTITFWWMPLLRLCSLYIPIRGGPTWYSMVFIEYPLFLHKNQVYILIYMYVYSEKWEKYHLRLLCSRNGLNNPKFGPLVDPAYPSFAHSPSASLSLSLTSTPGRQRWREARNCRRRRGKGTGRPRPKRSQGQ